MYGIRVQVHVLCVDAQLAPTNEGVKRGLKVEGMLYDELKKSSDCGAMPGIGSAVLEL